MEEALKREYPEHRFLGWQNKSAISGHLAQARAVVFSSRWYETQGLAPLEAAAHGVPTLCAETCAATENAIDGETGISFPQVTLPALTSALLRAQDDALISRLSHNVYKRFWAGSHGRESHADRLLALYNNINRM
jgi:glycosyltransferase involved in cell wall biosynthesis